MCIAFSLMLAISMVLSACGGEPTNLEEYAKNNEEFVQEIESYTAVGMAVDIEDNTLTYTYKYDNEFDDDVEKLMAKELKKSTASMSSTFTSIKEDLIDETGFSDIVVQIVYTDKNDNVLYEYQY